jgi:predicted O-methyltransferase YrrM
VDRFIESAVEQFAQDHTDVLWSGKVIDSKDDDARSIVAFNRLVQSDPRVENVCLTVRDGMRLAWKRK